MWDLVLIILANHTTLTVVWCAAIFHQCRVLRRLDCCMKSAVVVLNATFNMTYCWLYGWCWLWQEIMLLVKNIRLHFLLLKCTLFIFYIDKFWTHALIVTFTLTNLNDTLVLNVHDAACINLITSSLKFYQIYKKCKLSKLDTK